jgi:hypothetical protein
MIISELQYFPPVSFFNTLYNESYVYFDIYEVYRKMSFRNRCIIAGAQGIITLSVPLKDGRNQQLPFREVVISGVDRWQLRHFKSIQSVYNRSPFFEFYRDELMRLYLEPVEKLLEWNLLCLNWIKEKLAWQTEIRFTEKPIPYLMEGIEDRRNEVLPKNYQNWNLVTYRQVFEERKGFFNNLSALDLLFNMGPAAPELLQHSAFKQ